MADSNGDTSAAPMPSGGPHFLESEWVIWEHRAPDKNSKSYEDNMEKLCEVATIEELRGLTGLLSAQTLGVVTHVDVNTNQAPQSLDGVSATYGTQLRAIAVPRAEAPVLLQMRAYLEARDDIAARCKANNLKPGCNALLLGMGQLLLRKYAINKRLDLSDAFEEQCEPGLEKNLGVMDQTQFCCTMGVLFAGSVKYEVLEGVCAAYAATSDGPQKARPPVRFKRFAHDFDALVPTPEEVGSLSEQLPEWLTAELRILRRIAVEKRLDLSNAFEDQWAGPSREKLLGVMDKTQFLSVMGILFAGAQKMRVLQAVCDTYGAGDIDRRNGGRQLVRWRQFSNDFDTIEPAPLTIPGMLVDP